MFTFDPYLDRDELGIATGINVGGTDVTDRDLAQLARFPWLCSISLAFTKIGDGGLVHLHHLSELELPGGRGESHLVVLGMCVYRQVVDLLADAGHKAIAKS